MGLWKTGRGISSVLGLAACILFVTSTPVLADSGNVENGKSFHWDTWRSIVVQEGGRMKPLDTLAWEFIVGVAGRGSLTPEGFAPLSIADIRDWPGLAKALAEAAKDPKNPAQKRVAEKLSPKLKESLGKLNWDTAERHGKLKQLQADVVAVQNNHVDAEGALLPLEELETELAQQAAEAESHKLVQQYRSLKAELAAVDDAKSMLILELNDILGLRDLYDEQAWKGIELPEVASKLLEKKSQGLGPTELPVFNRALIASAFSPSIENFVPGTTKFGPARVADRKYPAVELYVTWLLTWQGWDQVKHFREFADESGEAMSMDAPDKIYWRFHKPDAWDELPMINARFEAMTPVLKPETIKGVSSRTVAANAEFRDWIGEITLKRRAELDLAPAEEKAADVYEAYMNFAHLRLGFNLHVGPNQSKDSQDWLPLVALIIDNERVASEYPSETIARLRAGFFQARQGLLENKPEMFNAGSQQFADTLKELGSRSHIYPAQTAIDQEVHYNSLQPFLWTAVLAIAATIILALSLGITNRYPYMVGYLTLLAAMGMMIYGMYLRVMISGRAPVTNMYETIIWSSFIAATIAVALGTIYHHRIVPMTAALLIALSTLLAYIMPIDMGATISPLQPVLRSNYWLTIHVLTIVASYGAFMLAWGLGNVGMVYYVLGKDRPEVIKPIAMFAYRAIQVGFLFLPPAPFLADGGRRTPGDVSGDGTLRKPGRLLPSSATRSFCTAGSRGSSNSSVCWRARFSRSPAS
ncbi:MAG: hypothetical protein U1D30_02930 [Planctomycetota bacterium]